MNLRALRLFRQIVLTGSLAEASERLNISASAASRLITLLEDELDIQLFSRDRRRLELTEQGDFFYRQVFHTLDGLEELRTIAADVRRKSADQLTIVTATPVAKGLVSPTLVHLKDQGIQFRCTVNLESRFAIESKVAARSYNLGLISLPVENAIIDLDAMPFLKTRLGVLLPRSHPLAVSTELEIGQLVDAQFIALTPRQRWRDRLDQLMADVSANPNIRIETTSTSLVVDMVARGLGITVIDRVCAGLDLDPRVVFRPLVRAPWLTYAGISAKGSQTVQATKFLDAVKRTIESHCEHTPLAKDDLVVV